MKATYGALKERILKRLKLERIVVPREVALVYDAGSEKVAELERSAHVPSHLSPRGEEHWAYVDALAMAVDLGQWMVNYYGESEDDRKLDTPAKRGLLVSTADWPGTRSGEPVSVACVAQAFHD